MSKKILFSFLFFLNILPVSLKGEESSNYLWPLEKFRELSSVFGEYRNFHFHSGIDIPTQKKTGFKVVAPESGWVFRIYTSWWGYGKALYLKLDNGKLVLFGHLSEFSPRIKELVEEKQLESKSYFLDFLLKQDQIRIKKGELIGFSGETGAGAPHLHFELRDDKNQPLNPLNHGFWVEDSLPPVIKKIAFRPIGMNSSVDGEDKVVILTLSPDSVGKNYTLKKTPVLSGKIGLEISAYDRMNERQLGIYKTSLYLDDELIFSSRYDTLNFETTWMVSLDRDFQLLNQGQGHFYKLYLDPGNELNLYHIPEPDNGVINTERLDSLSQKVYVQGTHNISISVEDVWGNLSSADFSVVFDKKPEIKITGIVTSEGQREISGKVNDDGRFSEIEIDSSPLDKLAWTKKKLVNSSRKNDFYWVEEINAPALFRIKARDETGLESDPSFFLLGMDKIVPDPREDDIKLNLNYFFEDGFLNFILEFNSILSKTPDLSLKVGGFEFQPLIIKQTAPSNYTAVYPFSETKVREVILKVKCESVFKETGFFERKIPLFIASPVYGGESVSQDGMAEIKIDSGVVLKDIQLKVKKSSSSKISRMKIEMYSFEPKDVPFAKYAWISLSYKEKSCDPEKLALYEYKNKSFRFVGKELDLDKETISGRVRYLSNYVLLEDKKAPGIKIIYPKKWQRIENKSPLIYAKIWDDLSGFGAKDGITVTVDNQWIIPEYDPEKGILKTRPHQPLSSGWHTLKVVARDMVGNQRTAKSKFKVIQ